MVNYTCTKCGKFFNKKSNYLTHINNKKKPCEASEEINKIGGIGDTIIGVNPPEMEKIKPSCNYCLKEFSRIDNLKRHIDEQRCPIIKLQKQQKENIFINLVKENEIENETKEKINQFIELNELIEKGTEKNKNKNVNEKNNMILILIKKLELQEKQNEEIKKQNEELKEQLKYQLNKHKETINEKLDDSVKKIIIQYDEKEKILIKKYEELEKNNLSLHKSNLKLQEKMNKVINKNHRIHNENLFINNTNNTTMTKNINSNNLIINYPTIKLVDFGKEDLNKIDNKVYFDAMIKTGPSLYQKTIEGIHFNPEHPEYQNIYISDINREKCMKYSDEKWVLENWDKIYGELLEKVIKYGYDKEQFIEECKINKKKITGYDVVKNGMRWIKLLDDEAPDLEYFSKDPEDRELLDDKTLKEYEEMQRFRKAHPKIETEKRIREGMKKTLYNKKDIPINNYKKIEYNKVNSKLLK